jgi:hypothetical protein
MKRLMVALALVVLAWPVAGVVEAAEQTTTVVVPLDDKPFKVGEKDTVRLSGEGIAGSKIEVKVDGPAKVTATDSISRRKNGAPLIGVTLKEFVLKPSGKGKVTAKITVTPPQPDAKPKVTDYEFEVE